jgi:hypothetical protein
MVLFLAAITPRLFNRVLGADDAPLGAVMGKRGDAGTVARGSGSSSRCTTTVAASASETPSRWARAVRASGGIAEGAQGRQQHGQEHVNPLIGFALTHAE